jgi:hypothetical protein
MHARIDSGQVKLLTRTGLDWSHRYRRTIEALAKLPVKSAYLDGERCALNSGGVPVFSRLQAAMDEGRTDELVFFAFDHANGHHRSPRCGMRGSSGSTRATQARAGRRRLSSWKRAEHGANRNAAALSESLCQQ